MSPQLENLFHQVADLPLAQRLSWLEANCPDPDLRQQVLRLVSFDSGAESFLSAPVASLAARITASPAAHPDAGNWRIVRPIGRGGMGAVYEAHRLDGEVLQRAAIKFVPLALQSGPVLERFRQERQILADLNHPNICRLIDAGSSADGAPFLVMELIEGLPIDQYVAQRNLDPRATVALFLPVCSAVQHAHRHLVIHRDLKPSNILVTPEGQPKLLDFGIAKLLDHAPPSQTTIHALTPDYASPEQLEGRPMNTATDVFSLGCVLYHLLTGEAPHRDLSSARHITLPRASARRTVLRGDLDNILNKCLQPEPDRRYPSVESFADDLRRFLDFKPVSATSDSWSYLALRFLRRHRAAAAALAVVTLTVVSASAVSLYQARRAQRRFTETRQLAGAFLFNFESQIRDLAGATAARQYVVQTAVSYLERLAADSSLDPSLQFELASAWRRVSEVQFDPNASSLGDLPGARSSLTRAQSLLAQILRDDPPFLAERIRCLLRLAEIDEASGRLPQSLANARDALALSDSLLRDDPSADLHRELASLSLARLARSARRRGDLPEATRALDRAISLDRLALNADPQSTDSALRLSSNLRLLARLQQAASDLPAAIETQRQANDILRSLRSQRPDSALLDRHLMIGDSLLGSLLQDSNLPQALDLLQSAHAAATRRAASDPVDSRAQLDLQALSIRHAIALLDARQHGPARAALLDAINASNRLLASDPSHREARLNHAIALVWQAELSPPDALNARRNARDIYETLLDQAPGDPDVLLPYALNAAALARLLAPAERAALCTHALAHINADSGPELDQAQSQLHHACHL